MQFEVYHLVKNCPLSQILEEGLKSRAVLLREGKFNVRNITHDMNDPLDTIWFYHISPEVLPIRSRDFNWVSFLVDGETEVYNRGLRVRRDKHQYAKSSIPLERYLEIQRRASELRANLSPSEAVVFHPTSHEPIIVNSDDYKFSREEWASVNELMIRREIIFPEEFARVNHKRELQ
jgi:hypothetical protein